MNAWLVLALCIGMEVLATSLLKASEGFSKPIFGWASLACYSVCFWALSFVLAKIPVGVAYAIWSGLGIVGITVVGWLVFRQSLDWRQFAFITLIVTGAVGLNLTSRVH
jgi:multidrug transporter EmrE-like cation transporter